MDAFGHVLIAGLATWQAVEVWRHGEICASWRAYYEARDDFVARLLTCGFCLSVWVGWLLYLSMASAVVLHWVVGGLAAARLANLGNDCFHAYCRTPRDHVPPGGGASPAPASVTAQTSVPSSEDPYRGPNSPAGTPPV